MKTWFVIPLLALSACGTPQWTKPGVGEAESAQAWARCELDAAQMYAANRQPTVILQPGNQPAGTIPAGTSPAAAAGSEFGRGMGEGLASGFEQARLAHLCMQAQGFTRR